VYRHVHGLRFEASYKEAALPQREVEGVIRALYKNGLIAYKGGHLEKRSTRQNGVTVCRFNGLWLSQSRFTLV